MFEMQDSHKNVTNTVNLSERSPIYAENEKPQQPLNPQQQQLNNLQQPQQYQQQSNQQQYQQPYQQPYQQQPYQQPYQQQPYQQQYQQQYQTNINHQL